jgi:DNA adenine methylase
MRHQKGLLRYFGGKVRLASWVASHLPPHDRYIEPFGGGAAVLLAKDRSPLEVYNDLDGDVVNLFRVLRCEVSAQRLGRAVALTPFSRLEFEAAFEIADDPVERARRLLARSCMGHGAQAVIGATTSFRNAPHRHPHQALDWARFPIRLAWVAERLRGVLVEQRDAAYVIERFATSTSVTYLDPPYPLEAIKNSRKRYNFTMTRNAHEELALLANRCAGAVVVSGYSIPWYEDLYRGWERVEKRATTHSGAHRTEVLWIRRPHLRPFGSQLT